MELSVCYYDTSTYKRQALRNISGRASIQARAESLAQAEYVEFLGMKTMILIQTAEHGIE